MKLSLLGLAPPPSPWWAAKHSSMTVVSVMRTACILSLGLLQTAVAQKDNAVTQVVTLLQKMKTQVENEAAADKQSNDKYSCWCKDTKAEKMGSIAESKRRLQEIETLLKTSTAQVEQLKVETTGHQKELKENAEALASAEALRAKQKEAFAKDEADTKKIITALDQAVQILQKKGGKVAAKTALLQVKQVLGTQGPEKIRQDLYALLGSLEKEGTPSLRTTQHLAALVQSIAPEAPKLSSGSSEVVGMMKSMKDHFVQELKSGTERDTTAETNFMQLKKAKQQELKGTQEQLQRKKEELANILLKRATADNDIASLKKSIEADTTYLQNAANDCKSEAANFANRTAARTEESLAIGETIQILKEDSARAAGKASFMQVSLGSGAAAAMQLASARLARGGNLVLAALLAHSGIDAFAHVQEVLKKSLLDLKAQEKADAAKRTECQTKLRTSDAAITEATRKGQVLVNTQQGHQLKIKGHNEDLSSIQHDINASKVSLAKASDERQQQHGIFQALLAENKQSVAVLQKALDRLKAYYASKGAALVQIKEHVAAPKPAKGQEFQKQHGGAAGVLQLLQKIINDAQKNEVLLVNAEKNAEKAYAQLTKDTSASIEALQNSLLTKQADLAKTKVASNEVQEATSANAAQLKQENQLLQAHCLECNDLLKNYDERVKARQEEMDSIRDASDILKGAKI